MTGHFDIPNALPANTPLSNANYIVQQAIGLGGFSIAYAAMDQSLNRHVAIKEFFPEGSRRVGLDVLPASDEAVETFNEARGSFIFEARNLARFHHPNIVTAHAFFEENNTAYLVMEYLEGQTLRKMVEDGQPLDEANAVGIIEKTGAALTAIHQGEGQRLLHRDVNPNNIMVTGNGRVVLMDFGLTQVLEETNSYQTRILRATPVFFTPGFAAPEQYKKNAPLTEATDVYGLAATLYFLISGKTPLDAQSRWMGPVDTLPELRVFQPAVSDAVNNAVKAAMAENPENRPPSVGAFLKLLGAGQVTTQTRPVVAASPKPAPGTNGKTARKPFQFKSGNAVSLSDVIALCERFPEEAVRYFADGSLANWLGEFLGESLLAGHIQGARQDCIRHLSGTNPSARVETEELRRGAEIMMRYLYRADGKPSLPKVVTFPERVDLGTIVSGHEAFATLRLANQGRGDAWGKVEVSPASPAVTVTPAFENLNENIQVKVDTTKYVPEPYSGHIVIKGDGGVVPCKVPLNFTVQQLQLNIQPASLNLGKLRCGTSGSVGVSLSWQPEAGRLVGSVFRIFGDALENREFYCKLDGTRNSFGIRISAPVLAVRARPYKEIYRLVTNAGNFDIPVEYRVALTGASL